MRSGAILLFVLSLLSLLIVDCPMSHRDFCQNACRFIDSASARLDLLDRYQMALTPMIKVIDLYVSNERCAQPLTDAIHSSPSLVD